MTDRSSDAKPAKPAPRKKSQPDAAAKQKPRQPAPIVEEIGGREGPDPTRYGDYEKNGRCVDF